MPWNPSPKVQTAREVAAKWGADQVVILLVNQRQGTLEMISYGKNARLCDEAGRLGDAAHDAVLATYVKEDA